MSHRVILDIVPGRIDPAAWAEAYDDACKVLMAHPARLLGYDSITVAGEPLQAYTCAIEGDRDDPTARRWCVAGERASLTTGEPQTLYRDLGRYLTPATMGRTALGPALDDVLLAIAADAPSAAPESLGPLGRALPAYPVPAGHAARDVPRLGGGLARVLPGGSPAPCGLPLLAAAMVVEARFPHWAMVHGDFDRTQAEA